MRRERWVRRSFLIVELGCVMAWGVAARGQSSQVLKLPPVPDREMDPSLRYHNDPTADLAGRKAIAAQNEKRRQLILWATNELVVLSERAEKAATGPPDDASKAELAANVNKIEALAKNLAVAMKAQ